jgi:hypothetical protein
LPKSLPQKKLQGYQLFDFLRFLHHTFFDTSTSFYCRNLCLGALERYFIEKKSKNKKTNNNLKKIGFDDLKWNYSKCIFFKNLKKIPMNINYMMNVCSKSTDRSRYDLHTSLNPRSTQGRTGHSSKATMVTGAFTNSHTKCQKGAFWRNFGGLLIFFCMDGRRGLLNPGRLWLHSPN